MAKLIQLYDSMVKEAEENKIAELTKYAEAADDLMKAEYGDDYTADDVEKLASLMYENDMKEEDGEVVDEGTEKVAELEEAGRIMARAFIEELQAAQ